MAGGKGKGRKKVEMVKMENQNNLLVTFSKRRAGVFKKASELSTLCGAEVAVVVFSPGEKVFSFGHPSVEAVVDKFLGNDNPPPHVNDSSGVALPTEQLIEAHRNARVSELITELSLIEMEMEMEKKRGEEIDRIVKANREAQGWMRGSYEELNLEQLVALNNGMETLMNDVCQKTYNQLMMTQGNGFPLGGSTSTALNGGARGASGGAGALPFSGGGATASGFPFSPFACGVTVFPPGGSTSSAHNGGGGGASGSAGALPFSGDSATASAFPANSYMPSGLNIASTSGSARALPYISDGTVTTSALPVNAYIPSGFNIARTSGGAGALPFSGGEAIASALLFNAYIPSGFNIASTSGGGGALPFSSGGATASAFPSNACMPSDASGGLGANLRNGPGFF